METGTPLRTDALFDAVYARLKAMAARELGRREHATLDTTALVHELYLRVGKQPELAFDTSGAVFRLCRARDASSARRSRARPPAPARRRRPDARHADRQRRCSSPSTAPSRRSRSTRRSIGSSETDARAAQVLELRYFAGLTPEQIAETLGLATRARSIATGASRARSSRPMR